MFVCIECQHLFETAMHYSDTHGLDTPLYEEFDGCPECGGAYVEAHKCNCCREWITEDYFKTEDGQRFCQNCCYHVTLEEE